MFIHATNITGVGASFVITSFIDAASEMGILDNSQIYLPADGPLGNYSSKKGYIFRYKRYLSNSYSRIIECIFSRFIFPKSEKIIVLGDLPLNGLKNQIVLVHQPNLVYPAINNLSSKKITYRIFRAIFNSNLKYVKQFIVQTEVMADELQRSYPKIIGRVKVVPQPVPNWFMQGTKTNNKQRGKILTLFYPAAGYPHKNHQLLIELNDLIQKDKINQISFEVYVTLSSEEYTPYKDIKFVKNLGRLNPSEVLERYQNCDALLFLSRMESYGLPLVESLKLGLPIVCVDLPYAKWMCGENAYYFSHKSPQSLVDSLIKLDFDLSQNLKPNYENELLKFPKSWSDVVVEFTK
jgi:hypothetical protein